MNIDFFLSKKLEETYYTGVCTYEPLYDNIENEKLRKLFSILHQEFNRLIKFMYSKSNGHYNAEQSRDLIKYINIYEQLSNILKKTDYSFSINEEYGMLLKTCKEFLSESGGSPIPEDIKHIQIIEYEPIFTINDIIDIKSKNDNGDYTYRLKFIGEGSYAKVYKYKDEFYNKKVIVKRAKKELNEKELGRFKREYETMNALKSPYILEVYRYDNEKNEYYAEYADETIGEYILNNNNKITKDDRKRIVFQILKAFKYIHRKKLLHRDISLSNILLKFYEDTVIIKVSDFGLVKIEDSTLTSVNSEVKGSLNDSNLHIVGFDKYSIEYETFALTRLIVFIMTGKTNISEIKDEKIVRFITKGLNSDIKKRYKDISEITNAFLESF